MKKVMMTMFFATLVPFIGENLTRYGLCMGVTGGGLIGGGDGPMRP